MNRQSRKILENIEFAWVGSSTYGLKSWGTFHGQDLNENNHKHNKSWLQGNPLELNVQQITFIELSADENEVAWAQQNSNGIENGGQIAGLQEDVDIRYWVP